ncbi:galactose oxidase-like domain-containing protein [Streptomyces sp. 900105245]
MGAIEASDYEMQSVFAETPTLACSDEKACREGAWEVMPFKNPVRSMHAVMLRTGKVLLIAGSGNDPSLFQAGSFTSALYDPSSRTFRLIATPEDMFCAGHVQLADGLILIMSGTKSYPAADGSVTYAGLRGSYTFDPTSESYIRVNDLNEGHWYPSATILGNGDVISLGGLGEDSNGSVVTERFSRAQHRWLPVNQVNQSWQFFGLYPSMILMQDGRLFYTGSHVFGDGLPGTGASVYDYEANKITDVPGLQDKNHRDQSMSVLLPPAQDQKVLTVGGGNILTNVDANRLTDIVDLKRKSPKYEKGPPLPHGVVDKGHGMVPEEGAEGKMYVSLVILPDGKVLEAGGALHNRADPVSEVSLFDPSINKFEPGMATDPIPRGYHSAAMLLPDARVMMVGDNPGNGSFDDHISIYSPPYLFKGSRPKITSVINDQWEYGSTQEITVDRGIVKAELIRPGAVTHSSDPNQRLIDLPLTVTASRIGVNVTSNSNMAPPGWYMLFVVDAEGIPSVARWVRLDANANKLQVPPATYRASAGNLAGDTLVPWEGRKSVRVNSEVSGCDYHYGTAGTCVPITFPSGVSASGPDRCEWLRMHGYKSLKSNSRRLDPLGLDANHDGLACGPEDRSRGG